MFLPAYCGSVDGDSHIDFLVVHGAVVCGVGLVNGLRAAIVWSRGLVKTTHRAANKMEERK